MKHHRRVFGILAFVVSCFLFACAAAELSTNLLLRTEYSKKNKSLVASQTYTDAEGNPVIASDKGYATIRYSYTTGNKVSKVELLDEKGKPVNGVEGYAVITRKYSDGKLAEQSYFDAAGKPVTGPEGYARMVTRYEYGHHVSTWRYDPEGNPVGWHRITKYTKAGKAESDSWLDPDGNLTAGPDGYARVEYGYTGSTLSRTAYLGADGEPYYCAKAGYATMESFYEAGKLRETRYTGADGELCAGPEGYAYVLYSYPGDRIRKMYYNPDGTLFFTKKGICGVEQTLDFKGRVCEERYFIAEDVRGRSTDGYGGVETQYNMAGKIGLQRYFDENDQTMVVESLGYAMVRREYHNKKYISVVTYYDEKGNPIAGPEGAAVIRYSYETGNILRTVRYFDADGETPANGAEGYARIEYTRDAKGNPVSTRFFDAEGNPFIGAQNADEIRNTWDGSSKISESYWAGGEPVSGKDGYHMAVYEYNASGKVFRTSFFDAEGQPTACAKGYAATETEYNSKGKVMSTRYYDTEGMLTLTPDKEYAYVRTVLFGDRKLLGDADDEAEEEAAEAAEDGDAEETPGTDGAEEDAEAIADGTIQEYYGTDGRLMNLEAGYAYAVNEMDGRGRVIRISYFDRDRNPAVTTQGISVIRRAYDEAGNVTAEWYLGTDGEPVTHTKNKYHRVERTFRDAKHITSEAWFDTEGNPIAVSDTYVRIEREFDGNGNTVRETTYDAEGKAAARKAGYDEILREFNGNNQVTRITYRLGGQPVPAGEGAATVCRSYDERGNLTAEWYLDAEGNPTACKAGYEVVERQYDAKNRKIFERYLDHEGQPMPDSKGVWQKTFDYDEQDRLVQEQYYGVDGELAPNSDGYVRKIILYGENGKVSEEIFE